MEYDRSKDPMLAMDFARSDAPRYSDLINEITDLRKKLGIAIQSLSLIAAPQRTDGTYNRDREACGKLARETLEMMK